MVAFDRFSRSSRTHAAKPSEEAHAGHPFQFPGLWLRVGQPGRRGGATELHLHRPRTAFTSEQHSVFRQRTDRRAGLRAQHFPGGRQRHERSELALV